MRAPKTQDNLRGAAYACWKKTTGYPDGNEPKPRGLPPSMPTPAASARALQSNEGVLLLR